MGYLNNLDRVAAADVAGLKKAAESYGDSWKKRGGVGAFMMLARKWDRLEKALNPDQAEGDSREAPIAARANAPVPAFDIFAAAKADPRSEGIIDDIRDLRRYLLLVEAELIAQEVVHGTHRDNDPVEVKGITYPKVTVERMQVASHLPTNEFCTCDNPDLGGTEHCPEHNRVSTDGV